MKFNPIAIVGQSCVLPGAMSPEELWDAVLQNKILMSKKHVQGFENIFNPHGFAVEASFIQKLDPLFQWTLHCGREAIKRTAWEQTRKRTAIVLGNLSYPNPGLNQ